MMEKCKKEILIKIWTREAKMMQMNSFKSKDKKVKKLGQEIPLIGQDVMISVLGNYLWRCSLRHSLAFFQWRDKFNQDSDVRIFYYNRHAETTIEGAVLL